MPSLSVDHRRAVQTQARRPGAFLPAEAQRPVQQAVHKPLEADGRLVERAVSRPRHPVDHRAAHDRLAHAGVRAPPRTVAEEIRDRGGEVVIRWQEAGPGDDTVPIVIRVAREREVEPFSEVDESTHRVGRRGVHPDLPVPVERHEAERGIDHVADADEVQAVAFRDAMPIVDAGPAERVNAQPELRAPDCIDVDHLGDLPRIGIEVVVAMNRGGAKRLRRREAPHTAQLAREELVRPVLDPPGDHRIRWPSVRGVVLEPAVARWIMRRRDDDAVGQTAGAPAVVDEDRMRNGRRRRVLVAGGQHDVHTVCGEHFDRGCERRPRQGVRVRPCEQGPVDLMRYPVLDRWLERSRRCAIR